MTSKKTEKERAKFVFAAREWLGKTQVEFAAQLDVTPRAVRRWECGETVVPYTVCLAIAYLCPARNPPFLQSRQR